MAVASLAIIVVRSPMPFVELVTTVSRGFYPSVSAAAP